MSKKEKKSPNFIFQLLAKLASYHSSKLGPCSYEMQDRLFEETKKKK